jgi:hypothetical protein
MRRVASLSGGVALVAGVLLVAPVSAAPPQRTSDTQHILLCEELEADGGSAFLVMGESEQFGTFAEAAFWPPDAPPATDDPTWIAMEAEVDFDGTSASATILMVEFVPSEEEPPFGDPVGNATVSATLTPEGGPEAYRFQDNSGNQLIRREGTVQAYSVTGTLTMPNGVEFDLSSCEAFTDTFTEFTNTPASTVSRFSSFDLNCGWETENGFVGLFATANEFDGFTEVFIADGEDEYFGFPSGPFTLTTAEFSADYEIVSATEGGDPVGTASASATLTPGERINERFVFGDVKQHVVGRSYLVDGTLTVTLNGQTTELAMDESSCFAADVTVTDHSSPGQGGGGRPLPNDLPEAAEPIEIGETVTVRNTGGTALEPEAPCVVTFEDGDFDVPLGHTAWWSFTGTGSPVTVDTTGSGFDTVAGVYADDGGTLTQVGCNDDFEGLEAQLTVDTEAGVTYYVQVGGFAGESGSLVLTIQ